MRGGRATPIGARVVAVADAYDAMTSNRPYRRAISHAAAAEVLAEQAAGQFDPAIVEAFIAAPAISAA